MTQYSERVHYHCLHVRSGGLYPVRGFNPNEERFYTPLTLCFEPTETNTKLILKCVCQFHQVNLSAMFFVNLAILDSVFDYSTVDSLE